jgi:hypothetical protein
VANGSKRAHTIWRNSGGSCFRRESVGGFRSKANVSAEGTCPSLCFRRLDICFAKQGANGSGAALQADEWRRRRRMSAELWGQRRLRLA